MFVAGTGVIYLFGVGWLALFTGLPKALSAGLWPFIPGDILKAICAALLLPNVRRVVDRTSGVSPDTSSIG